MFIKGNCAVYIAKNLKVYENSTVIFVYWYDRFNNLAFTNSTHRLTPYIQFRSPSKSNRGNVYFKHFKGPLQLSLSVFNYISRSVCMLQSQGILVNRSIDSLLQVANKLVPH